MRPAPRLVALGFAFAALAWAALWWSPVGWIGGALAALVAVVALFDALELRRRAPLELVRVMPRTFALGVRTRVRLELANAGSARERVEVHDGHPETAAVAGLPARGAIEPGATVGLEYELRPQQRGEQAFERAWLQRASRLGLWQRLERAGAPQLVRVLPNFARIASLDLRALEGRLLLLGVRRKRRRGEGMEFHQLRDYAPGDTLRQVDWKAAARRGKFVSREYQEERDQQVVLLLDCSRRMRAQDGELSYFDHCLNAALLVAYIALRQGDAVGVMAFGGTDRWIAPRKGRATLTGLLGSLYDLQAGLESPDYQRAAERLLERQKRRALVIVVTNSRDDDTSDLAPALALLRRRHVVLVANLREPAIEAAARPERVPDLEASLLACAANAYLEGRAAALRGLNRPGVLALDLLPRDLPTALAGKYLDFKGSGAL
ncbi:MAG: DUF58 domain-containing protein [Planctomycetota bacterium]|nr:MAG: DUF58 domain-containing protein [Planctomycetota bacterium]